MSEENTISESDAVQSIHKTLSPFAPAQRARILGAIFSLLEVSKIELPENYQLLVAERENTDPLRLSIDAFVRDKKPVTVPQRLACLAYHLEKHDQLTVVTAKDLKKANDGARQLPIDDVARDLSSAARRDGFFRKMKDHAYQLTSLGVGVVEALPDQERVRIVIEEQSNPHKRSTRTKVSRSK